MFDIPLVYFLGVSAIVFLLLGQTEYCLEEHYSTLYAVSVSYVHVRQAIGKALGKTADALDPSSAQTVAGGVQAAFRATGPETGTAARAVLGLGTSAAGESASSSIIGRGAQFIATTTVVTGIGMFIQANVNPEVLELPSTRDNREARKAAQAARQAAQRTQELDQMKEQQNALLLEVAEKAATKALAGVRAREQQEFRRQHQELAVSVIKEEENTGVSGPVLPSAPENSSSVFDVACVH